MKFLKSLLFNRIVLVVLVGAALVASVLDLYIDNSQSRVVKIAGMFLVKNCATAITELSEVYKTDAAKKGSEQLASFNAKLKQSKSPLSLEIFTVETAKDPFQKEAAAALTKKAAFYSSVDRSDEVGFLRYAVVNTAFPQENANTFLELNFQMDQLEDVENTEALKTLLVLMSLAVISSVSIAVFVGYMRHSTDVLSETQSEALEEQKKLTYAYGRFFPRQFLDLLNKKSVVDIKLGDQVEKRMAVLFADVRNFTALIETKSSAESFQIINEYLGDIGPIIRQQNGFIDKYIGDAVMALFAKPEDALLATLKIMDLLRRPSFKSGAPPRAISEIGAGLHFGSLMVGTVGEVERMDGTVISDVVNTSSRLESLNKSYGTHILISGQFLENLPSKERYKIRLIDHVFIKGKTDDLKIYEVFDVDSPEIIQKKELNRGEYDKAMECYQGRRLKEAMNYFQNCQKLFPQDRILSIFIKRCEKYLYEGLPENWTPIAKLYSKEDVD